MRRPSRVLLASVLVAVVAPLTGTGRSCGDLRCAGASVAVDLGSGSGADAAQICINSACEVVSGSAAGDWPAGWAELRFDATPVIVRDDEDFELEITVLAGDGSAIASTKHTRNFDVDECHCLAFPYRLADTTIDAQTDTPEYPASTRR